MAARSAQRQPHRHLPLTAGGLRQQQIGDIGAGDRQHQQHHYRECSEEYHHGAPVARRQRTGRLETETAVFLRRRVSLRKPPRDDAKFRRRLRARDIPPQSSGNRDPVVVARLVVAGVGQQSIQIAERHPELAVEDQVETAETRRRDAHHGEGMPR